jgi:hypothetical protein
MNFILVKMSATGIEIAQRFEGVDPDFKKGRTITAGHQLWQVDDFIATEEMIKSHNAIMQRVQKKPTAAQPGQLQPEQQWDWAKATHDDKSEFKRLYALKDYSAIMLLHNKLELTGEVYCCPRYKSLIDLNMEKALNNGTI